MNEKVKESNRKTNKKGTIKKRCSWVMKRGANKGEKCAKFVDNSGKHGSDLYCTSCLSKTTVKKLLLEKKRVSPTLTKLQEKIEKAMHEEEMCGISNIQNDEFQDVDLYNLLFEKNEEKLINSQSDEVLQSLSSHWKYILEIVTMKKEYSEYMVKILLWKSNYTLLRGAGKIFWLLQEGRWEKIEKETAFDFIDVLKKKIILDCMYFLNELTKNSTNLRLINDVEIIMEKLKTNKNVFVKKDTIKKFLPFIIDNKFNGEKNEQEEINYENPIGQKFLDETFEILNDDVYYGITGKKLYDLREEWIKQNPTGNIKSYSKNEIGIFGKLVKKHKTWKSKSGKTTKYLGIKLR